MVSWDGVVAPGVMTGLGKLEAEIRYFGLSGKGGKSDSAEIESIVGPGVTISALNF